MIFDRSKVTVVAVSIQVRRSCSDPLESLARYGDRGATGIIFVTLLLGLLYSMISSPISYLYPPASWLIISASLINCRCITETINPPCYPFLFYRGARITLTNGFCSASSPLLTYSRSFDAAFVTPFISWRNAPTATVTSLSSPAPLWVLRLTKFAFQRCGLHVIRSCEPLQSLPCQEVYQRFSKEVCDWVRLVCQRRGHWAHR